MEQRKREYLVARICAGYIRYKIKSGDCLIIKPLTVHQNYELQEIYLEAYDRAFEDNLLTDEEVVEMIKQIDSGEKKIDSDRWRLLRKELR